MRILIKNSRIRTQLRLLGKARTTSTVTGNDNNLVVLQERVALLITLTDTDDESEGDRGEAENGDVFHDDDQHQRSVEVLGQLFQQSFQQEEPLTPAQIEEIEREVFMCVKCNAEFATWVEIEQHGVGVHHPSAEH